MTGFNTKIGAGVLLGLSVVYMVGSLATGRNARAERSAELKADEAGLDIYRTASFLLKESGKVAVVDVRSKERFDLYHLPGAKSLPGANSQAILSSSGDKAGVLIIAESDKDASALTAELLKEKPQTHFLKDGVRAWYMTFELPVELFTDKPAPRGYAESVNAVKGCLSGNCSDPAGALEAVGILAKSPYEPSMLQGKKPAAAGGAKKKISGGCGG